MKIGPIISKINKFHDGCVGEAGEHHIVAPTTCREVHYPGHVQDGKSQGLEASSIKPTTMPVHVQYAV
jgi:hypothetical protein